jgi:hypothetical protein
MNKVLLLSLLALGYQTASAQLVTESFGSGANAFTMDFVTIGNPGNAAYDGIDNWGNSYSAGSVAYYYNLGKYEVSRDMVLKASTDGGLDLALKDLSTFGGNLPNRPATGITWNQAARFANWLNISKGYQPAYNFTTSGVNANITLWGAGQYSGSNQFRHKDAYYFLPSVDEWYKGAYGSPNGAWCDFPNGSDIAPSAVSGGTSGAVYKQMGPSDITNAGGLSSYGTMAQGGNAAEWLESSFDGTNDNPNENRIYRGGGWASDRYSALFPDLHSEFSELSSSVAWGRYDGNPEGGNGSAAEYYFVGFRVAMIPEPSALSLLAVGLGALAMLRRRRS